MSIFVPMEKKEFSLDINSPNKFLRVVGAVLVCMYRVSDKLVDN